MCGFAVAINYKGSSDGLRHHFDRIQYRGPDNAQHRSFDEDVHFSFYRLAIMDLTESGNQPMCHPEDSELVLVCNGEIYNHAELRDKYKFNVASGSDSEIILHMYKKWGLKRTLYELDGVFAFVLYDRRKDVFHVARDPFGVRPAFWGYDDNGALFVASEAKAMSELVSKARTFPPGHSMSFYKWQLRAPTVDSYFKYPKVMAEDVAEEELLIQIRQRLTRSVQKRLMSDRPLGCLLSGGLDSSLIASLVSNSLKQPVHTFSIGMEGSVDLEYARQVAEHIGSIHHEVELSEQDFLDAIEMVIYRTESYDTTTIRASVGNTLVSKYIKENTDCTVIFNGDGSDEVCCGYFYNINAPSLDELQKESIRLVRELYLFDVLRSDRSISSNGLEARTPFLDPEFVQYYLSIQPQFKAFDEHKMEKYLLRKAFDGTGLLPDSVLWRRKCAFSDGVSSKSRSWHQILQEKINEEISDRELREHGYKHCPPVLKESLFYRRCFERIFGAKNNMLIPHFWMPKWTDVIDPSARELDGYHESGDLIKERYASK